VRHTARGDRNCGENAKNKYKAWALFKRIWSALKGTSHKAHCDRIEISVLGGAFENAHQMRFKSASVLPGGEAFSRGKKQHQNKNILLSLVLRRISTPCCHPEKMAGTSNLIGTCNFSRCVEPRDTHVHTCRHSGKSFWIKTGESMDFFKKLSFYFCRLILTNNKRRNKLASGESR